MRAHSAPHDVAHNCEIFAVADFSSQFLNVGGSLPKTYIDSVTTNASAFAYLLLVGAVNDLSTNWMAKQSCDRLCASIGAPLNAGRGRLRKPSCRTRCQGGHLF